MVSAEGAANTIPSACCGRVGAISTANVGKATTRHPAAGGSASAYQIAVGPTFVDVAELAQRAQLTGNACRIGRSYLVRPCTYPGWVDFCRVAFYAIGFVCIVACVQTQTNALTVIASRLPVWRGEPA